MDNEEHAAKQIVISACSLEKFEYRFDEPVEEFCSSLNTRFALRGRMLDFSEYLRYFLGDVFGHLAYGKPFNCVAAGGDTDGNIKAIQGLYGISAAVGLLPWLLMPVVSNNLIKMHFLQMTSAIQGLNQLKRRHDRMTREKKERMDCKNQGFLDGIATHIPGRISPSDDEVQAEYITFTAATLDGVAAFVSPFVDNLVQHAQVKSKLLADIRTAEANGWLSSPVAQFHELAKLSYFQACITQTLRRNAPAQTLLPRVAPKGGLQYHDIHIPEGSEVAASPGLVHRNEEVFGPDAETLCPERWSGDPKSVARMHKYAMWWGCGTRECAGKNYAQLEMQKLCFELFRRFDIGIAVPEQCFILERDAVGMFWNEALFLKEHGTEHQPI